MAWFGRKKDDEMSVESLVAKANTATPLAEQPAPVDPTAPVVPTAPPAAASPAAAVTGSFRLPVDDVFTIRGRGTVVTGQVASGTVTVGMRVSVYRGDQVTRTVKVTGVEMFRKIVDTATVGANVGLLLSDVTAADISSGDVIAG